MIEINLLPGSRKSTRGKAAAFDTGAMFTSVTSQVKDPFLIVAVAGLVIGLGLTAYMYASLGGRRTAALEREVTAVNDSARYAGVIAERAAAAAARDSIVRQFAIIKAIDGERYTWPHVLNELSAHLPAYTWLARVEQVSPVISVAAPPAPPPDTAGGKRPRQKTVEEIADAAANQVTQLKLRVIGQTVDYQAMTRYMRLLEQSPFIENVVFIVSDIKADQGREVIEFTLEMNFEQPPASAIRTIPLSVAVR